MSAHRLIGLVRDVINWDLTRTFYREFGLVETSEGRFSSVSGGMQLELRAADTPAVARIDIGVDTAADLDEIQQSLAAIDVASTRSAIALEARDPGTGIRVRLTVADRLPPEQPVVEGLLRRDELVAREPVRPLRLGHIVIGCTDVEAGKRFFLDGLGMRLSDYVTDGPFMRFERDHHNIVLVPAPFTLLHHTAWKVRSIDEIGYGGSRMIENHPQRHAWGLGRHAASANYFWYLRDPSGAFAEYYYSDLDERAPDKFFWDRLADMPELPVAAWASPALQDAPLAPMTPEQMPAPLLEDALAGTGRAYTQGDLR